MDFFKEGLSGKSGNNLTGLLVFILILLAIAALVMLYYYWARKYNLKTARNINLKKKDFYSLCRNVELSGDESKILLNLVFKNEIKYPLTVFTSAKVLDDILKKAFKEIENDKTLADEQKTARNSAFLDIKAKIEANSRRNIGIRSTRFIHIDQKIIIFCRGKGYFYAAVRRIFNEFITVELLSSNVTTAIFVKGDFIKVYFWREEDAGYTFESQIANVSTDPKIYNINHSERLQRTQKRKYKRVPANITGEIFPVYGRVENGKKIFNVADGQKQACNIFDLSAGGLKLRLTGPVRKEDKVFRIDFLLNKKNISIIGKLIRLRQYEDSSSEITIQFARFTLEDKNVINKYVYNYLPGYQ
jgi:c-di-GMP-binding flagellar brake protein YcgR